MFLALTTLLCLLAVGLGSRVAECPAGLNRFYLQTKGNYCYRFVFNYKRDYDAAQADCRKNGGNLAMPKSKDINDFLIDTLLHTYEHVDMAWIGLNDRRDEDEFDWIDGTRLKSGSFAPWATDNGPRGFWSMKHVEDCVTLNPFEGKWHDFHCSDYAIGPNQQKSFICEYVLPPTPKPTTPKPTTPAPTKFVCPPFICNKDCGMDGYLADPKTGCSICKCDD